MPRKQATSKPMRTLGEKRRRATTTKSADTAISAAVRKPLLMGGALFRNQSLRTRAVLKAIGQSHDKNSDRSLTSQNAERAWGIDRVPAGRSSSEVPSSPARPWGNRSAGSI